MEIMVKLEIHHKNIRYGEISLGWNRKQHFTHNFKSSGLRIEQPGKTSTRQAKKYCINRHALAHQATCIIATYSATAWQGR